MKTKLYIYSPGLKQDQSVLIPLWALLVALGAGLLPEKLLQALGHPTLVQLVAHLHQSGGRRLNKTSLRLIRVSGFKQVLFSQEDLSCIQRRTLYNCNFNGVSVLVLCKDFN